MTAHYCFNCGSEDTSLVEWARGDFRWACGKCFGGATQEPRLPRTDFIDVEHHMHTEVARDYGAGEPPGYIARCDCGWESRVASQSIVRDLYAAHIVDRAVTLIEARDELKERLG